MSQRAGIDELAEERHWREQCQFILNVWILVWDAPDVVSEDDFSMLLDVSREAATWGARAERGEEMTKLRDKLWECREKKLRGGLAPRAASDDS